MNFKSVFLYTILIASLCSVSLAYASNEIQLSHESISAKDLPAPGAKMSLGVRIVNSSNTKLTVRALLVRDGRLMDVPASKISFNEQDELIYTAEFNAPLSELNYRFVLLQNKDTAITTKRFTVQRDCTPSVELTDVAIGKNTPAHKLVQINRGLEHDLASYDTALALVKELEHSVNKGK